MARVGDSRCATCRHFHKARNKCRFNPPVIVGDDHEGRWPIVDPSDWCSQHEPQMTAAKARKIMKQMFGKDWEDDDQRRTTGR